MESLSKLHVRGRLAVKSVIIDVIIVTFLVDYDRCSFILWVEFHHPFFNITVEQCGIQDFQQTKFIAYSYMI